MVGRQEIRHAREEAEEDVSHDGKGKTHLRNSLPDYPAFNLQLLLIMQLTRESDTAPSPSATPDVRQGVGTFTLPLS